VANRWYNNTHEQNLIVSRSRVRMNYRKNGRYIQVRDGQNRFIRRCIRFLWVGSQTFLLFVKPLHSNYYFHFRLSRPTHLYCDLTVRLQLVQF